jgi:hypothetical protein
MSMTPGVRFKALTQLSSRELEKIFAASRGPALESLAGNEFMGYNVPWFTEALRIRKFVKGFFGAKDVEGYNIPVRQNGIEKPWEHQPSADHPKRFGFYKVGKVDAKSRDNHYPEAVLLDYGASARNLRFQVERLLRDYLVVPDPKNPEVLLGKAYLAFGGSRVPTSFFVLERLRQTPWHPGQ